MSIADFKKELLLHFSDTTTFDDFPDWLIAAFRSWKVQKEVAEDLVEQLESTTIEDVSTPPPAKMKNKEDDKSSTPFVRKTPYGRYVACKWNPKTQKTVYLGTYDTLAEAEQAVAAYVANGTILPYTNKHSKYKGVTCVKGRATSQASWQARRETGMGKSHIGTFFNEDEAGKAVKNTGSFKAFYDNYPDK
jgi:hypothetical protein